MIYANIFHHNNEEKEKKLTVLTDECYNELIKKLNKVIQENEYLKAKNKELRDENLKLDDDHLYYNSKLHKLADLVEELLDE